ncbi:MAG: type II secretion system protein GspM [Pigmentiphaga sp.]|uniref:type II secretion system protein GspM n=1 Tax=Pigmentiphaga sp. TaxID=1977564 RepID=UPI0029B07611|nr:type II secretion system protein GspM [Pigmentiphaga sp.]MDX3908157.1 type II secretion system protein GspM [Pigmentiphaga sp.]
MRLPAFTLSTPPALIRLRTDAGRRWARLAPRERRLLAVAGAVAAAAIVFLLFIEPAWTRYTRLEEQLPLLRTQAARVDALTAEARSLQRTRSGQMTPEETRQALAESLQRAGIAGEITAAEPASGPAGAWQVTVEAVQASGFMQWLASVPGYTRLQLTEADLERPKDGDGRLLTGKVTGAVLFAPATAGQER